MQPIAHDKIHSLRKRSILLAGIKQSVRWEAANSHHWPTDEMSSITLLAFVLWLLCSSFLAAESSLPGKDTWLRPGCHKVGNTRKISIPDCVEFTITTNACRGFCESYAVPSVPTALTGLFRPPKPVVSVGQCCNMMKSEEVSELGLVSN
ncbi:uncharacterized protein Dvir_GJ13167 [Drosophila virilis]|uniref:DAN domain-containing protein n=1 Tax=Drosophila virilis TaxID=7244 RepID=B4LQP5_DROVI|nr:uncharacterized protein Dvir_GJ13167 [Drosophila virilis]